MLATVTSMSAAGRVSGAAPRAPTAAAVPRARLGAARAVVVAVASAPPTRAPLLRWLAVRTRATPSEEGVMAEGQQEGEDADPFEVPQTGRTAPMSEDKHADTPEQSAAPEGDRAILGQKWQPTKQDGQTPEDRYGSKEAAQEAAEAAKDRSRKSDLQTGDLDGDYGRGGA